MVNILLADDHAVLRSGLRLLLERQPDLRVIGEASNGAEAIQMCEQLRPDLLILDLSMPGIHGLDALGSIKHSCPNTQILILTMHDDADYLRQALTHGASGYLLKKAADNDLLAAVRAICNGEIYIHSTMTRALLDDLITQQTRPECGDWENLSPREQEVLKLVALGHTAAEIAEKLILSVKTVETYRARGMEKLGLDSRAALVRFALKKGLISGE